MRLKRQRDSTVHKFVCSLCLFSLLLAAAPNHHLHVRFLHFFLLSCDSPTRSLFVFFLDRFCLKKGVDQSSQVRVYWIGTLFFAKDEFFIFFMIEGSKTKLIGLLIWTQLLQSNFFFCQLWRTAQPGTLSFRSCLHSFVFDSIVFSTSWQPASARCGRQTHSRTLCKPPSDMKDRVEKKTSFLQIAAATFLREQIYANSANWINKRKKIKDLYQILFRRRIKVWGLQPQMRRRNWAVLVAVQQLLKCPTSMSDRASLGKHARKVRSCWGETRIALNYHWCLFDLAAYE